MTFEFTMGVRTYYAVEPILWAEKITHSVTDYADFRARLDFCPRFART